MRARRRPGRRSSLGWAVPALLLTASGVGASGVEAQEAPAGPGGARTRVEAGVRVTHLQSERAILLGGAALFDLGGRFLFGGGAWSLREPLDVVAAERLTTLRLRLGYGGALAGWTIARRDGARATARVLAGAGTARMTLTGSGAEIAADNFLVVEPSVSTTVPVVGPVGVHAELSWRWVRGVEDLPGVGSDHIRGVSASLGITLGPF